MDEDPSLNANLASINVLDNLTVLFLFTLNDFNLRKEWSLTFNKLGTKARTWAMKDDRES